MKDQPWLSDPVVATNADQPWLNDKVVARKPTRAEIDAVSPANGMPWYEKALVGAGAAASRAGRGVTNLIRDPMPADWFPNGKPTDARGVEDAALYQKYHPGGAATAGEVGADIAMSAIPVARAGSVLKRALAARSVPAAALAGDVAANAAYSAATAPEDRGEAALWGAGGAAVGRGLGRIATGIVKPTEDAAALIRQGVRLTPGQAAGKGSAMNWMEQGLASNPVSAYPINAARSRALQDANMAAARAVASHVDGTIKLGRSPVEAIEQVRDRLSGVYDEVLPRLSLPRRELVSLTDQIAKHVPDEAMLVSKKQQKKLADYLDRRVLGDDAHIDSDATGQLLKQVDAELGSYARTLAKSTSAEEKVAAPMWYDAQQKWREYVMKAAAPDSADFARLSQANAGYRELLAVEKALKGSGGETIKPRALAKTLEASGIKRGKLADLSRQMDSTMPGTVPDSGTASRVLLNSLPAAVAGGSFLTGIAPVVGVGAAAAAALGTQVGTRAMTGLTIPQKALVNMLIERGLTQSQAEEVVKVAAAQAGRATATQR